MSLDERGSLESAQVQQMRLMVPSRPWLLASLDRALVGCGDTSHSFVLLPPTLPPLRKEWFHSQCRDKSQMAQTLLQTVVDFTVGFWPSSAQYSKRRFAQMLLGKIPLLLRKWVFKSLILVVILEVGMRPTCAATLWGPWQTGLGAQAIPYAAKRSRNRDRAWIFEKTTELLNQQTLKLVLTLDFLSCNSSQIV